MNPLEGQCHCGAVSFKVARQPDWLTACNCSICRRLGTLWLHDDLTEIELSMAPDSTITYVWGDRELAFHTCKQCGCTTHWSPLDAEKTTHMAVNARMMSPEFVASTRIRQFDGADSWQFLD